MTVGAVYAWLAVFWLLMVVGLVRLLEVLA